MNTSDTTEKAFERRERRRGGADAGGGFVKNEFSVTRQQTFSQIINTTIMRQRRSDISLYNQWRNNDEFRADYTNLKTEKIE